MKELVRIIDSVIAFIFGITILLTAIFTGANIGIIILGAILSIVGLGCFVWALLDNKFNKK